MGRSHWIGLVFGAFSVLLPQATWANAQDGPTVRVVLHDSSAAPGELLAEASGFAIGAFRTAGIEVAMATGDQARVCTTNASAHFCIQVLLRPRHPEFAPGKRRPMGVALAADRNRAVVSVYLDAVTDVARRYGLPLGKVLGIAIAHEIGHVMLPPPSHSPAGIMQASWEGDDLRHAPAATWRSPTRKVGAMRESLSNRISDRRSAQAQPHHRLVGDDVAHRVVERLAERAGVEDDALDAFGAAVVVHRVHQAAAQSLLAMRGLPCRR